MNIFFSFHHKFFHLLNQNFVSHCPDVTFWLDAPIETGMARARERGALDRFEQEKVSFFEKVRAGYAHLWQQQPARIQKIDATQGVDHVYQQALSIVQQCR